jgi:sugar/nucleoside kinase (ribokinase family)
MNQSVKSGIYCVGNLIVDKIMKIDTYPRESMLAHIQSRSKYCGGGCLNALFNLSIVDPNLPLSLAGIIGKDNDGKLILDKCKKHNVNVNSVSQSALFQTSFTDVMINTETGQRTFFHYSGANNALDLAYIENLNSNAKIAHLAYLLVLPALDVHDPIYGSKGAHALFLLQEKGFETSLDLISDTNPVRFQELVKPALIYVNHLIINDEEACALLGVDLINHPNDIFFENLCLEIYALGVKSTVIIHYPRGASAYSKTEGLVSVAAYIVPIEEIVSTLGAGDAFCSGVLYGLHENIPLQTSLKIGNALAHYNLGSTSATDGAIEFNEIMIFIEQYENTSPEIC